MNKFIPSYHLFESTQDEKYWFKKMEQGHKDYIKDEEEYNSPWDEEEDGPKFWIFPDPVNQILKRLDMILIVPALIGVGEELGLKEKDVELHYMMLNDFCIDWNGYNNYPSISIEGMTNRSEDNPFQDNKLFLPKDMDNSEFKKLTDAGVPLDDFNPYTHATYILITVFKAPNTQKNFNLYKKEQIPDIILDIRDYLLK